MNVQTAFRLDESMIKLMKQRARQRKQSVNAYVAELISNDLKTSLTLPKVQIPSCLDEDVEKLAGVLGVPSEYDLENDDRLRRIWER